MPAIITSGTLLALCSWLLQHAACMHSTFANMLAKSCGAVPSHRAGIIPSINVVLDTNAAQYLATHAAQAPPHCVIH